MPDAFGFKYFFLAVNFTSTEFVIMNVASMKVIAYGDDPNFASQWITTDGTYVTITNPVSWLIRVTMF